MKLLILLLTAGCFSLAANAQENSINSDIFKKKPWEEYKMRRLLRDTLSHLYHAPAKTYKVPVKNELDVLYQPLSGTFTGYNEKGDEIYDMSTDKMPCLVPNKKVITGMPVTGVEKTNSKLLPLLKKDK